MTTPLQFNTEPSGRNLPFLEEGRLNSAAAEVITPDAGQGPSIGSTRPRRTFHHLSVIAFAVGVLAVLAVGWLNRDDSLLTAEEGLGYMLGIVGGSAMLALLLYPLRKRLRFMHRWGPVKYWFKTHMLLGVVGPAMILFHANFSLGSANSNLALLSMLAVAISGLFGRYFYARIHHGLYGAHATLKELRAELQINKGKLTHRFTLSTTVARRLRRFEKAALRRRPFALGVIWLAIIPLRAVWTYLVNSYSIRRDLRKQAQQRHWDRDMLQVFQSDARQTLRAYIATVRQAAELGIYAKLFSLWHLFHMPLFFLLVITGVVHVVAVHLY